MFTLWTLELLSHMNRFMMPGKVTFVTKLILTILTLELLSHMYRFMMLGKVTFAQQDKYSYSVQDDFIQDTVQFSANYSLWPPGRVVRSESSEKIYSQVDCLKDGNASQDEQQVLS